jgi:hypothetical protein
MIAQIDEEQITMITLSIDPTREAHCLSSVLGAKLAAGVRTISVHDLKTFLSIKAG